MPHVCSSAQVEGDAQVHEDEARTCESFLSFIREDTSGGVYEPNTIRAKSTSNAPPDKYLRGTCYVLVRSRSWSEGRGRPVVQFAYAESEMPWRHLTARDGQVMLYEGLGWRKNECGCDFLRR